MQINKKFRIIWKVIIILLFLFGSWDVVSNYRGICNNASNYTVTNYYPQSYLIKTELQSEKETRSVYFVSLKEIKNTPVKLDTLDISYTSEIVYGVLLIFAFSLLVYYIVDAFIW